MYKECLFSEPKYEKMDRDDINITFNRFLNETSKFNTGIERYVYYSVIWLRVYPCVCLFFKIKLITKSFQLKPLSFQP